MSLNSGINTAELGSGFVYSNGLGGLSANSGVVVTKFTSSNTWTKNSQTQAVTVISWNGGGGGGSGRQGATTAAGGGGGGSSGSSMQWTGLAIFFNSSETVTIGGAGTGGATQGSNLTNGINGTGGSLSSLGNVFASDGAVGNFGSGGTTTNSAFGNVPTNWIPGFGVGPGIQGPTSVRGSNSAPGNSPDIQWTQTNTGGNVTYANGYGGSGSGANAVTAQQAGSSGNILSPGGNDSSAGTILNAAGTGGIETGTINGGTGNNQISTTGGRYVGSTGGGGGGGQSSGLVGGTGGNGGINGGGGGGGGGSISGTTSGAGGNGGRGELWVIEYLG